MHGLPAVPEDVYLQIAGTGSLMRPTVRTIPSSAASVMNIYGSTGDLYQHLRPAATRFQQPVIRNQSSVAAPHPHLLERTSSVSSALDAGSMAIYGTIRRGAPIPYRHPPPPYNSIGGVIPAATSPTRPFHPVHPVQQQQHPPRYFPAQSNPSAAQEFYHGYPSGSGTIPLPAKRQSTYGVPSTTSSPTSITAAAAATTTITTTTTLSSSSSSSSSSSRFPPPPPHKDEREAPEGASSSPGLTHDVTM